MPSASSLELWWERRSSSPRRSCFRMSEDPGRLSACGRLGGVLSLIGAFCYAELATTYPRSGGDYQYLTRAFGSWVGFLFGWAQLAVILTGSIASMAYAFRRLRRAVVGTRTRLHLLAGRRRHFHSVVDESAGRDGGQSHAEPAQPRQDVGAGGHRPGQSAMYGTRIDAGNGADQWHRLGTWHWFLYSTPTEDGTMPRSSQRKCGIDNATCRGHFFWAWALSRRSICW